MALAKRVQVPPTRSYCHRHGGVVKKASEEVKEVKKRQKEEEKEEVKEVNKRKKEEKKN